MPPSTPAAWRDLLIKHLDARWAEWRVYDAYYEGDQTLAYATRKFRDAYGGLFKQLTDNWMPIVVDSSVERLKVQGFRFGDNQEADEDAWDIWQANNLDGEANLVHTEAVKLGTAYWMVQPGETPKITGEHPSQVICYHAPGDRKNRLAAVKKWNEDKDIRCNVYLPDRVVKYRTNKQLLELRDQDRRWETLGTEFNPLGVVPVIPVENNPSMLRGGRSDLAGGPLRVQDSINMMLGSLLIGAEFIAYPQRVVLGVDQPVDAEGNPLRNFDLQLGQSRLWMFPGDASEIDIKEFKEADLDNIGKQIERLRRSLTSQTRTPPHYVSGEIVNVSGDALKAAETGLVSKVRDKMDPFGEAHEEVMRLSFRSLNASDPRAEATDAETIWRDPESRSQAETVDAAVKKQALGVPWEQLMEDIGYSPQQIDRMAAMRETESLLAPEPPPPNPELNGAGARAVPAPY
jgi:hypothetical protein